MIVLDGKYVHFILDFNNVISMSVLAGVERLYVYVIIAFNISDYSSISVYELIYKVGMQYSNLIL